MQKLPDSKLELPKLGFGLGGLPSWTPGPVTEADIVLVERLMNCACDAGISLFDTASPYALGRSETVMGHVFARNPDLRKQAIIQTKCGQILCDDDGNPVPPRIDLSYNEIRSSTERSLRRLGVDCIDVLLLHQPSPLMKPEEIARAFDDLHRSGKVRHFGLSNFNASQATLIQRASTQRLVTNQVQISLFQPQAILDGMAATLGILEHLDLVHQKLTGASSANAGTRHWVPRSESLLDHCRIEEIVVQAWSPLRRAPPGLYRPQADFAALDEMLGHLARVLQVTPSAVALAWLLKHPAGLVPISSTSSVDHLMQNIKAIDLNLSDDDWYDLLREAVRSIDC